MATTPSGPFKPPGASKTTQSGPWGGGNHYIQMPKPEQGFTKVTPIAGHTQKLNIQPVIRNKRGK